MLLPLCIAMVGFQRGKSPRPLGPFETVVSLNKGDVLKIDNKAPFKAKRFQQLLLKTGFKLTTAATGNPTIIQVGDEIVVVSPGSQAFKVPNTVIVDLMKGHVDVQSIDSGFGVLMRSRAGVAKRPPLSLRIIVKTHHITTAAVGTLFHVTDMNHIIVIENGLGQVPLELTDTDTGKTWKLAAGDTYKDKD